MILQSCFSLKYICLDVVYLQTLFKTNVNDDYATRNSSNYMLTSFQRFLIVWFKNTDFSAIGRETQYTRDAFLITVAFSRLSAEITTQLPLEVVGSAMKAFTNYFPRGSPPKVTRHTSSWTDEVFNEKKMNTKIIAHVRLIVIMVDIITLQTYFTNKWNKFLYRDNFYFISFMTLVSVYQANELSFNT